MLGTVLTSVSHQAPVERIDLTSGINTAVFIDLWYWLISNNMMVVLIEGGGGDGWPI